ncbi:MAG: FlgD immunoglobulin-like domain containing protein [Candidatus Tenebribacter davisii]|nr:FlgD immunoglobulin-like domain containing protein [Candidatus Tenebribacter davisii]
MKKMNYLVFLTILLTFFSSLLFAQENVASMVNLDVKPASNSNIKEGILNNTDPQRSRELYQLDDGSSEETLGMTPASDFMVLNAFEAIAGSEIIGSISIAWGTPGDVTPTGHPVRLILYNDPTNDWDPSDAVYLTEASTTITNPDTDIFTTVTIPATMVSGVFYIASLYENATGLFPCSLDITTTQGSSWYVCTTSPGTFDVNDIGDPSYDFPLDLIDNYGHPGNWLLRADTIPPPEIEVTPLSFDINLETGQMDTQVLTIENIGDSHLDFIITKEITSGERAESYPSNNTNSRAIGDILGSYGNSTAFSIGIVLVDDLFYSVNVAFNLDVIDPAGQVVIASYPIHPDPFGITWDGTYLWIGDVNGDVFSYNLDGTSAGGSFSCPSTAFHALTWDGDYFIVNNIYVTNPTFYRLDNTGTVIEMFSSSFGGFSEQIVWVPEHENGNLWSCGLFGSYVSQFNLNSGSGTAEFITQFIPPDAGEIYSITHDSFDLWLSDWDGPLYKIDDGINEGWLYCSTTNGIIAPGNSSYINVSFDATNLVEGIYEANLHIINNDPDESYLEIPVTITVAPPIEAGTILPAITQLHQNHPNPFNPTTIISFDLVNAGEVTLNVYNVKGELVRTLASENLSAGYNSVTWNGTDENNKQVSSGVYFYKLKAGNYEETKKMILLK